MNYQHQERLSDNDPTEGNHLLCGYLRLYNNSLLNAVCLIDMVFYLVALTFNLTWTLIEVLGQSHSLAGNSPVLHLCYGAIMLGNVLVLVYAVHFKIYYRRYNVLVKNTYFNTYYYMRICWGVMCCVLAVVVFVWLMTQVKGPEADTYEFHRFRRTSNLFSIVYVVYAAFGFASSAGFRKSWYGMLSKDVNFYYS